MWLECILCKAQYEAQKVRYTCSCGGLLSVERQAGFFQKLSPARFDERLTSRDIIDQSGVWRFREAVLDAEPSEIVTHPEGSTRLYQRKSLSRFAGIDDLFFKHEGENPTGSFKDRGMTVAITQARRLGARAVACASTGNTSASLASYAAQAGLMPIVFLPAGKVALGKLAQTLAYGARCLAVQGDFDDAMRLVSQVSEELNIYLLNSINPFRIEGQKTIIWETLQNLAWEAPDWIALPAGNLGNTSAFGKALLEAYEGGWIKKLPRLAAIQAKGANPFYQSFREGFQNRYKVSAETIASAIRIGNPVSYEKARLSIQKTRGVVSEVSDEEILLAKRAIDRAGIGCEPASACSLAGVKKLCQEGTIQPGEKVVCVLTGNILKDPDIIVQKAREEHGQIIEVAPEADAVRKALAALEEEEAQR